MENRIISIDDWSGTKAELQARIDAFAQAKADHALTEDVPAPFETSLVEQLYYSKDTFGLLPPPKVPVPLTPEQIKDMANARIQAQMDAADIKIIRALTEGDVERIAAHRDAQALMRGKLSK